MIRIPTLQSVAFYSQRTTIDDTEYVLRFKWNERDGAWFMDILDEDEGALALGLKLVPGWPILYYVPPLDYLPRGDFYVYTTDGTAAEPTLDNLGTDFELLYITPEEIAGL